MVQDIIGELRSFKGDTLGEVFKKFSLYINSNNSLIASNIAAILSSFKPENNFERILRLKLIDKYHRTNELFNLFDEEDIFSISRALNLKWFYSQCEIETSTLVNEVLPSLSYSVRYKFLRRYSVYLKDAKKAEEIFKLLQQRYGSECALSILPACSPDFVKDFLFMNTIQLKPMIITFLNKAFPDIILEYIIFVLENKASDKRHYRHFSFNNYSNIFHKIASKYPLRFLELYAKHNCYFPYMKLGNRTTKRLLRANSEIIIKQWDTFKNIFEVKHIKRYLSLSQLEEVQATYFPEKLGDFFDSHWILDQIADITSHLEEEKRQEILMRNFQKVYNKEFNVDKFSKFINLDVIVLIPVDMRIKWIQSKIPSLEPDSKVAEYLSYLPPDISLPALKDLIVKQKEFSVRGHMVKCMLASSKRYKDSKSLLICIEYVVHRLRNDNIRVREIVFDELYRMKDILCNLQVEEWSIIEELIDLVRMNDEMTNFNYSLRTILAVKIEKYFTEQLLTAEILKKYVDLLFSVEPNYYDFCKESSCYKKCLEFFLATLPSVNFDNERSKNESTQTLFISLSEFNCSHKEDMIKYPEWMLDNIEKILLKNDSRYGRNELIQHICKQPELKERIFTKIFPGFINENIALYILRKYPLKIKENCEKCLKKMLQSYGFTDFKSFFKMISLYSPFDLPQTVIDHCKIMLRDEQIDSKNSYHLKPNAVIVLSVLESTENFIQFVTPYKPTKKQFEEYSDENKLQYKIQQGVASSLKYVNKPSEILSFIKSFAVGDYLKLVVGSIDSVCLKVAEKKILPLLIEWLDSPVSLRKHFIRAYYKIASISDCGKLIVSLLNKEKNSSIRVLLLEHIYKYFLKEPSQETFEVFKTGYGQLNSEDVSAVENLFDLKKIPDMFLASFVKMLWDAIELKEAQLIKQNKTKVVNMIDSDILSMLPEEFCDDLLNHCFQFDDFTEFHSFLTIYLLYAPKNNLQLLRLEKVLQRVKEIIQKDWNNYDINRSVVFETRRSVFYFINSVCDEGIEVERLPINPTSLMENLKIFLLSLVPEIEILDELVKLEVAMFITTHEITQDDFLNKLAKFYEKLLIKNCTEFGDLIIPTIVSLMPYCLQKYSPQLAKILLFEHSSYQAQLMALKLIDTTINQDLPTYKNIIEHLLKCTHPIVKAAAVDILRNFSSNVHIS